MSDDGHDDPLRHLHDRIVGGDRRALEELAGILLDTLPRTLRRPGMTVDPFQTITAVVDAIMEYAARPERFDPCRSVPLARYVGMIARRNLEDAVLAAARRAAREGRYAMEAPPVCPPPPNASETFDVERLYRAARAICDDDREYEALCLLLAGEHDTMVVAAALGLSHVPPAEQRRAVKRFRERAMGRLLRYLRRLMTRA